MPPVEGLEQAVTHRPLVASPERMTLGSVTVAVGWHFIHQMLPQLVPAARFAALATFSQTVERLPAFAPDVLLLDIQMPEVSGLDVAAGDPMVADGVAELANIVAGVAGLDFSLPTATYRRRR